MNSLKGRRQNKRRNIQVRERESNATNTGINTKIGKIYRLRMGLDLPLRTEHD